MKFSTRTRYGLKAVIDLAAAFGQGPLSLAVLAGNQGISEAYLEQLMRTLMREGIVKSVRGVNGGYLLAKEPEKLSALEVISVLEGGAVVASCVGAGSSSCGNEGSCSARPLFLKLQSRIDEVLKKTTIFELAEDYNEHQRRKDNETSIS
ncbi:MAG: Rrf2 family transcriptional regulator [Clostridia bacterium]|nr:Rrf2 family transcriptional regulator [Clostridia bacterium]